MAIKLIANYSKRLGLPGYSSHQFELSIESEITNTSEVQAASADIYNTLQSAVDEQIQQVGFVPDEQYGRGNSSPATPSSTPSSSNRGNGYGNHSARPDTPAPQEDRWQCTEKQQSMILGLVSLKTPVPGTPRHPEAHPACGFFYLLGEGVQLHAAALSPPSSRVGQAIPRSCLT